MTSAELFSSSSGHEDVADLGNDELGLQREEDQEASWIKASIQPLKNVHVNSEVVTKFFQHL